MTVERPPTEAADAVADMWVDLAADQRRHGSHLLAEPNRERAREAALRGIVTDSLLVATDGDDPIGFVTFDVESGVYEQDVTRGFVENVYVVPDRRGRGVGAALLAAAEERLRDRGCDAFFLEVLAANDDARRFYREAGYEPHRVQFERSADDSKGAGDAGEPVDGGGEEPATESDTHTRDD
ncbi:MAG: GNAT family N-acetyltransferase [Haloarculaceae archaeon]